MTIILNSPHFFALMRDKKYAITYLSSKDSHEFAKEKLMKLIKEYKTLETKDSINRLYLSIVDFLKMKNYSIKFQKKRNELGESFQKCIDNIEVFESELAALLLLEIIDIERAKELGYDYKYLKLLLKEYKTKTETGEYMGLHTPCVRKPNDVPYNPYPYPRSKPIERYHKFL